MASGEPEHTRATSWIGASRAQRPFRETGGREAENRRHLPVADPKQSLLRRYDCSTFKSGKSAFVGLGPAAEVGVDSLDLRDGAKIKDLATRKRESRLKISSKAAARSLRISVSGPVNNGWPTVAAVTASDCATCAMRNATSSRFGRHYPARRWQPDSMEPEPFLPARWRSLRSARSAHRWRFDFTNVGLRPPANLATRTPLYLDQYPERNGFVGNTCRQSVCRCTQARKCKA